MLLLPSVAATFQESDTSLLSVVFLRRRNTPSEIGGGFTKELENQLELCVFPLRFKLLLLICVELHECRIFAESPESSDWQFQKQTMTALKRLCQHLQTLGFYHLQIH